MRQPWWTIFVGLGFACMALLVYSFFETSFFDPGPRSGLSARFLYGHLGTWGIRVLLLVCAALLMAGANRGRHVP